MTHNLSPLVIKEHNTVLWVKKCFRRASLEQRYNVDEQDAVTTPSSCSQTRTKSDADNNCFSTRSYSPQISWREHILYFNHSAKRYPLLGVLQLRLFNFYRAMLAQSAVMRQ